MPVTECQSDNKPGFKWGKHGNKCYTYSPDNETSKKEARKKAILQGVAIGFEEFAKVGERGGISKSKKAPKSNTPNPNPKGEGTAKGSASSQRGAVVSKEVEETLKKKSDDFNERYKKKLGYGVNLGMLKSVYQRGIGAYNVSHSPQVKSAGQWAQARVNAFLYLVKEGRPQNKKYVGDNDLLPSAHPKSKKKFEFKGVKVSFDYHDTLTTDKGKEYLQKEIDNGNIIYIISASHFISNLRNFGKKYGINENRIFATGSNKNKVEKIKELNIVRHYDNSKQVEDLIKENKIKVELIKV